MRWPTTRTSRSRPTSTSSRRSRGGSPSSTPRCSTRPSRRNPGAVITEYAWTAQPTRSLAATAPVRSVPTGDPEDADMMTLGADIIGGPIQQGGYVRGPACTRVRQDGHEGRPAVPAGQAGRRRPRGVESQGHRVRRVRPPRPGRTTSERALRDPLLVDRPYEVPAHPIRGVWGGPPGGAQPGDRARARRRSPARQAAARGA